MHILFIHQSMPGQFPHLAKYMKHGGHRVSFMTMSKRAQMAGINKILYEVRPAKRNPPHPFLANLQTGINRGEAVAENLLQAKRNGFRPDIIYGHPGWGETLYVKDVFPDVPLIHYCEFFYHPFGADTFYDPSEWVRLRDVFRLRMKNSVNLLNLENCDQGISPTRWQWSQHPAEYRSKISIIHDGVDTDLVKPNSSAQFVLPNGDVLNRNDEVVTFVARSLEPYRGFPAFMRAIEIVSRERPSCHFLIVGGDDVSYGRRAPNEKSYREILLDEIKIDEARVHFLGRVPYDRFINLLQVSSLHVYLTLPFVLSWSMIEAMSAGCVVLGSDTAPVTEVLEDGMNGFLVDLLSPDDIASRIQELLDRRATLDAVRNSARATVLDKYALKYTLPKQVELIEQVLMKGAGRGSVLPEPVEAQRLGAG